MLVKHTGAGKEIAMNDVVLLLGNYTSEVLGRRLLEKLLFWLHSNRRTDASFKLVNQTHLEMGLSLMIQSSKIMYFIFPFIFESVAKIIRLLAVATNQSPNALETRRRFVTSIRRFYYNLFSYVRFSNLTETALSSSCQTVLHWQNRLKVSKVFRDPNSYEPNINRI